MKETKVIADASLSPLRKTAIWEATDIGSLNYPSLCYFQTKQQIRPGRPTNKNHPAGAKK